MIGTLVGIAASDSGGDGEGTAPKRDGLSGSVTVDGAAAMRGLVQSAAARFEDRHPGVRITVGASGDESSIAIFCAGEVEIAAVARRLDRAERRACWSSGTRYVPIEVAREGIALVVSRQNAFAGCLRVDQARAVWRRAEPLTSWNQVDPAYPAADLKPVGWNPDSPPYTLLAQGLFGPLEPETRNDYDEIGNTAELATAVAATPDALGYLPVGKLRRAHGVRPLALDGGRGCVLPSESTVRDGSYPALSRSLYLDMSVDALRHPEARRFVREYLAKPPPISAAPGAIEVRASHRVYRKFTRP